MFDVECISIRCTYYFNIITITSSVRFSISYYIRNPTSEDSDTVLVSMSFDGFADSIKPLQRTLSASHWGLPPDLRFCVNARIALCTLWILERGRDTWLDGSHAAVVVLVSRDPWKLNKQSFSLLFSCREDADCSCGLIDETWKQLEISYQPLRSYWSISEIVSQFFVVLPRINPVCKILVYK